MTTLMAKPKTHTLTINPSDVEDSLPIDFLDSNKNPGHGFSDKLLTIPVLDSHVQYQISYDGESELLYEIVDNPQELPEEKAQGLLSDFFMSAEDEEDEDDSEEEEDEEE